jgi:23S rRNA (guanosine2251-2'-O)-methyltransferase
VVGPRAVAELLDAAPRRVTRVWIGRGRKLDPNKAGLLDRARSLGIATSTCEDLNTLVGSDARGIAAEATPLETVAFDELLPESTSAGGSTILVALDGVVDPQNLGAIIRTCEFFGVRGVFFAKDRSAPVGPAAVRASAGATERVPLCAVTNLARALLQAAEAGFWVIGTVADEGRPIAEMIATDELPDRLVLVLGGEERGLRRLTRQRCDFLVTIERRGALASLNVGAAAAICLALLTLPRR